MPTPDLPPPDPDNELAPYWESDELRIAYQLALGQFVDAYGRTENALSHYLSRFVAGCFGSHTEQGLALAKAIIGSQRIGQLSETMKRTMRVAKHDAGYQDELAKTLDHLGAIHSIRDRIVHQGAMPEFYEGKWRVRNTNVSQIREAHQEEEIFFTIEDLESMTADLALVQLKIRIALFRRHPGDLAMLQALQQPWRYKPSELVPLHRGFDWLGRV
ncbi:MAG: hypothetical protein M3Q08_15815 [Pseudomonadota bacterium]|nr:hypothetical protein [Pseudomonadota bacterium]